MAERARSTRRCRSPHSCCRPPQPRRMPCHPAPPLLRSRPPHPEGEPIAVHPLVAPALFVAGVVLLVWATPLCAWLLWAGFSARERPIELCLELWKVRRHHHQLELAQDGFLSLTSEQELERLVDQHLR